MDWVVIVSEATPLRVIRELKPLVLAKGSDWDLNPIVGREEVESWGDMSSGYGRYPACAPSAGSRGFDPVGIEPETGRTLRAGTS